MGGPIDLFTIEVWKNFDDMQMKFSARINSSCTRTSVSSTYFGEKWYSLDAGMELFSIKLRQMVAFPWNLFI